MLRAAFNRVKHSELLSVSFFSGISTVIKLATAFVTAKIIAFYIGPAGLGVIGQLSSFIAIVLPLSVGAVSNGIVKYLSEFEEDKSRQNEVIKAAIIITACCSLMIASVTVVFAENWSLMLFGENNDYSSIIIVFGITLICYALFTLFTSVLNGLKEYKKYNYLNIISSIIGLVFSLILIHLYGLNGALFSMVTYQSVVVIIFFFFIPKIKQLNWNQIKQVKINTATYFNLFQFSLMAIVSSIVVPLTQIFIRTIINSRVDAVSVGFYEAINRISIMYLGVITTTLSIYYLPRLSSISSKKLLKQELYKGYAIILPVTFVLLLGVYIFKGFVIKIVFSQAFTHMEDYFLPQLAGDFFKIASWLLAFQMWAKAMVKTFIITETLASLSLGVLSYWLIQIYGGVGAVYAYLINYLLYFVSMLFIFRKLIFYRSEDEIVSQID
jgi:O-antigen/teichoic acid export membrane protein